MSGKNEEGTTDGGPTQERAERKSLRRQLKAYALAAAATVTVLASLTSGRWDYARMDRELSDYHFAYYARSA